MQPFSSAHRRTVPQPLFLLRLVLVVMATQTSQGARCDRKWREAINEITKVITDIPKTSCKKTALGCFSAEFNVVRFEFGALQKTWTVKRILKGIEESMVDTGVCAQCESYQERPVGVFLENLLNFLQLLLWSEMCGT
ncbi:UNVERIFIED_CONTAM: hypothetical protein FKN15_055839 [Acipenser sinensis]